MKENWLLVKSNDLHIHEREKKIEKRKAGSLKPWDV